MLAELRGWTRFAGLQIQYSLIERTVERELLPMAKARELAVTPWGILGSGVLAGDQIDRLDEANRIELGFPYDFLNLPPVREVLFGTLDHRIDRPR